MRRIRESMRNAHPSRRVERLARLAPSRAGGRKKSGALRVAATTATDLMGLVAPRMGPSLSLAVQEANAAHKLGISIAAL